MRTPQGEIIIIIHQAADMVRDSKTILSSGQLEAFGCLVNDKAKKVTNRTPYISTPEGYKIPISIKRGLPYLQVRPFMDNDWEQLPHVTLTSPREWDPTCLDSEVQDQWYKRQPKALESVEAGPFTKTGELKDGRDDNEDMDDDDHDH